MSVDQQREVAVETGSVTLPGLLGVPENPLATVVFAHGSGSSRLSPRNQRVAAELRRAGLATLLFDLLTDPEAADRRRVFDIPLLADRLAGAVGWVRARSEPGGRRVGLFGASTGAAAALMAAARWDGRIGAVVSRGGRPDLAEAVLGRVRCATLLIVGGRDASVLELNRSALERLAGERSLEVVSGAGHLFEEPGALEEVARLARRWFLAHLSE